MTRPVRIPYRPNAEALRVLLPDMGESLHNAARELSRNVTIERLDAYLARLQAASDYCRQLRRSLAQGKRS